MSSGFFALLDDVASIARVAAASLDDTALQASRAGAKVAGVVVDDVALTPRFAFGFSASRELPIVWKIGVGSLRNKLYYLAPAALVLGAAAPWMITPLLMAGGTYLCFEGAEKVLEMTRGESHADTGTESLPAVADAVALENAKVNGAIRTDFILSSEIMAITLGSVEGASLFTQGTVLVIVGIGITVAVYGGVALLVRMDDIGLALATNDRPASTMFGLLPASGGAASPEPPVASAMARITGRARQLMNSTARATDTALFRVTRPVGRGMVRIMPKVLDGLGLIGTVAMLWVGGGIVLHGLTKYAPESVTHAIETVTEYGFIYALACTVFGLALGAVAMPVVHYGIGPATETMAPVAARGMAWLKRMRARLPF